MDWKHQILNRKGALDKPPVNYSSEEANQLIYDALSDNKAIMIARFGAFELGITTSVFTPYNLRNLLRLLKGDIATLGWNSKLANQFCNNAGFFPNTYQQIARFAHLLVEDMSQVDILASWLANEKLFSDKLMHAKKIRRIDLEPFNYNIPWTKVLRGKKILVIHPYEDSIKHQWENRDKLFNNPYILPEFDLKILKAVQSAACNQTPFKTWFEALDYMKDQINLIDFDIALIGCGAYGFHLAAHIKRIGKKAVHIGGVLQMLFGIVGKRWENKVSFINDNWIRPLPSDIIDNANSIENGCYW